MPRMEATPEQMQSFAAALERALDGRQRAWLGAQIAREVGRPTPLTASAVNQWIACTSEPSREFVFAAERVLSLPPGALSRHLGYLPINAKNIRTPADAIGADTKLSDETRRVLLRAYKAAIGDD